MRSQFERSAHTWYVPEKLWEERYRERKLKEMERELEQERRRCEGSKGKDGRGSETRRGEAGENASSSKAKGDSKMNARARSKSRAHESDDIVSSSQPRVPLATDAEKGLPFPPLLSTHAQAHRDSHPDYLLVEVRVEESVTVEHDPYARVYEREDYRIPKLLWSRGEGTGDSGNPAKTRYRHGNEWGSVRGQDGLAETWTRASVVAGRRVRTRTRS